MFLSQIYFWGKAYLEYNEEHETTMPLFRETNVSKRHITVTMASFGKVFRCFRRSGEKSTSEEELT